VTHPAQGGERPHVTVTIDLQDLRNGVGAATLEHGGPISAGEARMLACNARIVPAVLSGPSQVLDVGAAYPAAIRRAITLRDRGCMLGFERPAQ
jgi:5-methylcytosine-specific restriction protein A